MTVWDLRECGERMASENKNFVLIQDFTKTNVPKTPAMTLSAQQGAANHQFDFKFENAFVACHAMAANFGLDYFALGSRLRLTTCLGDAYEGDVIAYSPGAMYCVLQVPTSGERCEKTVFLNMDKISDCRVLSEPTADIDLTRYVSIAEIQTKLQQNISDRMNKIIIPAKLGISEYGRELFSYLSQQYATNRVEWLKPDRIVVCGESASLSISPPYHGDECLSWNKSDNVKKQNLELLASHLQHFYDISSHGV